jgi:hypothetical protein
MIVSGLVLTILGRAYTAFLGAMQQESIAFLRGLLLSILARAQAMMPHHPNVEKWRRKAAEDQISAYSRQSDLTNSTRVDAKATPRPGCNRR